MDKDLQSYLKVFKDWIPLNVCHQAVEELKKADNNFFLHSFYDPVDNKLVSYENELSIAFLKFNHKDILMQRIWDGLNDYMAFLEEKELSDVINSWAGFTDIRFNRYQTNTKMKRHCDHIQSMFDGKRKGIPILSVIGALNDDYTGGELVFWNEKAVELKAGEIMIFPSNFLYPHEVKVVTEGTRYSYVSWVW